jgi:LPXTG-motif cell wall-anchored protein
MKKVVLMFSVIAMLSIGHFSSAMAQSEEKEKKDSVSIDSTDPVFYDAEEDEDAGGSKTGMLLGIVAAVLIVGTGAFILLKKKKK